MTTELELVKSLLQMGAAGAVVEGALMRVCVRK